MLGVFSMQTCPDCNIEIRVRELRHQGLLKNFRICPNCGGSFTADTDTKYRQAICIFIAIISLAITMLLYFEGKEWLIPAIFSYVILGLIIYWGNKRIFFVPYKNDQNTTNDTYQAAYKPLHYVQIIGVRVNYIVYMGWIHRSRPDNHIKGRFSRYLTSS